MARTAYARRLLQQRVNQVLNRTLPDLGPLRRRVLAAMVERTPEGWHLFAHRDLPFVRGARAEAYLVGPGGVFALLITDRAVGDGVALEVLRSAGEWAERVRGPGGRVLPPSAIHLVVVGPGDGPRAEGGRAAWVLTERELPELFERDARHLGIGVVDGLAEQVAAALPDYAPLSARPPEHPPEVPGLSQARDPIGPVRPFEEWLTFLHPEQRAAAGRAHAGPSRICGPAGTGKTVVALHRLRRLAREHGGPLLFTSAAPAFPSVQKESFRRLAPESVDRVRFVDLHTWARDFLAARGVEVSVSATQVQAAFNRAWMVHRKSLHGWEPSPGYWRTEVDQVIKGRGVRTLQDYVDTPRRGRALELDATQRAWVWQLHLTYQANLAERDLIDHHDLIDLAAAELARSPLEEPYLAVVADEAQDIPLTALRLLRDLGGDGLVLVGDGRQQVHPGAWLLSEADIPFEARVDTLRVDHRHHTEILDFAKRIQTTNQVIDEVDDLEDPNTTPDDTEATTPGGEIRAWHGPIEDLPTALTKAVCHSPVPAGRTALVVFQNHDLEHCTAILRQAGIPFAHLDDYRGEEGEGPWIGTITHTKGLGFQGVLVVQFATPGEAGPAAETRRRVLRGRQHLVAATRAREYLWWAVVTGT